MDKIIEELTTTFAFVSDFLKKVGSKYLFGFKSLHCLPTFLRATF